MYLDQNFLLALSTLYCYKPTLLVFFLLHTSGHFLMFTASRLPNPFYSINPVYSMLFTSLCLLRPVYSILFIPSCLLRPVFSILSTLRTIPSCARRAITSGDLISARNIETNLKNFKNLSPRKIREFLREI